MFTAILVAAVGAAAAAEEQTVRNPGRISAEGGNTTRPAKEGYRATALPPCCEFPVSLAP